MNLKVDIGIDANPQHVVVAIKRAESLGYDGVRLAETNHDPFVALTLAAEHSRSLQLVTSVVVALARSPMQLALQAHELNTYAKGRLILGLGSQIRPHIERRFSMPMHKPARQMREYLEALQAIFACWYEGKRLDFHGDYYRFDLMPKTFVPPDKRFGRPALMLSATGPLMTKVAAEVADGLITHPFSSLEYLEQMTLPAVQAGLGKSGRSRVDFTIDHAPMVAIATRDQDLERAIDATKERIAFYARTVAYRPVLELHGWEALQDELIALHRQHRGTEAVGLVSDEILHTLAVVGSPEQVVARLRQRLVGVVDRTALAFPPMADARVTQYLSTLCKPVES